MSAQSNPHAAIFIEPPDLTDSLLLDSLRAFAPTSRSLGQSDFNKWAPRPCTASTIARRFGGWQCALKAAGLSPPSPPTPEQLIDALRGLWISLGRAPTPRELRERTPFSPSTYARRWGSFRHVCKLLARHENGHITRDELLAITPRRAISSRARFLILQRDNHTCQSCGSRVPDCRLEIDHILPVSHAGSNDPTNLRALCADCNRGRGSTLRAQPTPSIPPPSQPSIRADLSHPWPTSPGISHTRPQTSSIWAHLGHLWPLSLLPIAMTLLAIGTLSHLHRYHPPRALMPKASFFLPLLLTAACIAAASAQSPPPPAAPPSTLNDIAESHRSLVKQRAMHFYRMPDGTIWDGWNYKEWRDVLDRNLKAFDRMERGQGEPGQALVEDKRIGTVWKIKLTPDAKAWGLVGGLAGETGELLENAFESSHPENWKDAPPLWSCATATSEYAWPFAYIDEQDLDEYTRQTHKCYLEITRDLGQGRYEVKGYSLDRGGISGLVYVSDPAKFIRRDRFKGRFFLWDMGEAEGGGNSWKLLPADDVRMTADGLADALLNGKAQLVTWTYDRVKDKTVWKRTVREIDLNRTPQPLVDKPPTKPPPPIPGGGPDLVVLNDGRWFRGRILKKDAASLVIRTYIGQSEMDMTFTMDEVKEFQAPEKRP